MGFVPFWKAGHLGIVENVFRYLSQNNAIFHNMFLLPIFQDLISSRLLWFIFLGLFAFVFHKRDGFQSLLVYTMIMVGVSPGISNQYFSIVIPYLSVNFNIFSILFTIIGTWYLSIDEYGLNIKTLQGLADIDRGSYYSVLVFILTLGFIWVEWREEIIGFYQRLRDEIKSQLTIK